MHNNTQVHDPPFIAAPCPLGLKLLRLELSYNMSELGTAFDFAACLRAFVPPPGLPGGCSLEVRCQLGAAAVCACTVVADGCLLTRSVTGAVDCFTGSSSASLRPNNASSQACL